MIWKCTKSLCVSSISLFLCHTDDLCFSNAPWIQDLLLQDQEMGARVDCNCNHSCSKGLDYVLQACGGSDIEPDIGEQLSGVGDIERSKSKSLVPSFESVTQRKKSKVNFAVRINYGRDDEASRDAFELYLAAPPHPIDEDPIAYWVKQRAAAIAVENKDGECLAQMALDFLSAPGKFLSASVSFILNILPATSVDPEQLFSFSGGTISKLRNQLSENSAWATVLLGQWMVL